MLRSALILCVLAATAAAQPATINITATKLSHMAVPTVAAGGPGFVVVWEEKAPTGQDKRHIAAAIVSDAGKVVLAPKRLLDGGGMPNELTAVWNGTSFTVVVCNSSWDEKSKLVWGELALDGTFKRSGEVTLKTGDQFICKIASASATGVDVIATSAEEGFNDDDEMTSRECKSWRITLAAGKAAVGKPAKLCTVEGADASWYFGTDAKDRATFVDLKRKAVAPKKLNPPKAIAASGGKFALLSSAPKGGMAIAWIEPPFKTVPTPVVVEAGPLGAAQVSEISMTKDGGFVSAGRTPKGLEVVAYKPDGKLGWSGIVASKPQYHACAASTAGTSVLCIWTDDDSKFMGEVRAALIPAP